MVAVGGASVDREAWLESRKSQLGASDVAAVLGVSPWSSAWEVWAEKTGRIDGWDGNAATKIGQRVESAVLDEAEAELGPLTRDVRVIHESLPVSATLDAITETGLPVEAKTTGLAGRVYGDWGDAMTDEIPEYYLVQVHTQLLVTGADLAYLFALIGGRGFVEYRIERNDGLMDVLGEKLDEWWRRHVVAGVEPERKTLPSLEVLKRVRRVPKKQIELGQDALSLIERRDAAKTELKDASDRSKEAEAELLLLLGDAEGGQLPDGRQLTYMMSNRKGYTVEPSSFRTLRVKKAQ